MAKKAQKGILLPVSGCFASDYPKGYRYDPFEGCSSTLTLPANLDEKARMFNFSDALFGRPDRVSDRTYKSCITEMLAAVRDSGDVRCEANLLFGLSVQLQHDGYIVAVGARKDDPMRIDIIFGLTDKGRAFLVEQEAPVEW